MACPDLHDLTTSQGAPVITPGTSIPFTATRNGSFTGSVIESGSYVLTLGSVTVPAGTFNDALIVTETSSAGSLYQTLWFANGVGLVQRQIAGDNDWVLTGFSGTTPPVPEISSFGMLLAGIGVLRRHVMRRRAVAVRNGSDTRT